jgi:hypothetical protein
MASTKHLQVINLSHSGVGSSGGGTDVLFPFFLLLSTELRLRIWQSSIEQHRLLEVEVDRRWNAGDAPTYSTTNTHDKLISGRNYTATVRGCHLHSKLLRVNSESRQAALSFYRVHIPCYFRTGEFEDGTERTIKSTLYFNPEYDFMFLRAKHAPEHTFVEFLHDLKSYDPKHIGLLNLALDINSMTVLHSLTNISEATARAAFVDTLQRLQEIFWVAQSRSGRAILGPLESFQGAGIRFNHSMPLKVSTPTFQLRQDPRAIGPDLKYVLTAYSDPRQMRVQWRQLLAKWQIQQAVPTKERVLFAFEVPEEQQVCDIKTANEFLIVEETKWLKTQQKWHRVVMRHAGKVPVESPEELAEVVRPAIGFWLFPVEALGDLEGDFSEMKKVFDMTGYWPELALSCLS